MKIIVVTDPMCSWCWGMAAQTDEMRRRLGDRVRFELMLAGVNTHGSQPIGEYGERHLYHIWREVEATTGAAFAYALPKGCVYNSTLPVMALRARMRATGCDGFDDLHRLQQDFFLHRINVNDQAYLERALCDAQFPVQALREALVDASLQALVRFEFENARSYGTNALPNLLLEQGAQRRLLAGGYLDCDMLEQLLERAGNHGSEAVHVD